MKSAVILAGGPGTRIWPYAQIRPKVMIPIANKPIIGYITDKLKELGFDNIVIIGGNYSEQIKNYFFTDEKITVLDTANPKGAAFSIADAKSYIKDDTFLTLYGDTVISKTDVKRLIEKHESGKESVTALVSMLKHERCNEHICCSVENDYIEHIAAHPRGEYDSEYYVFAAYAFDKSFMPYLSNNPGMFTGESGNLQVGMMPATEGFVEASVADYMKRGNRVAATITEETFIDIDKPWHILLANHIMVEKLCNQIEDNSEKNDSVDPTASIKGKVRLGRGSKIGRNVIINGNVILGDDSVIENGAILSGNVIIGKNSYVGNYCLVEGNTTIGDRCVVSHCAELSGMIMDGVYLYHYMEISGIVGTNTDIGAATVCGTLRFDDGDTTHRVKGRKEVPKYFSNDVYIGDYCRTGVNAILMPGKKVGVYSIVGPGVLLTEDVPDRTIVTVSQTLIKKEWGPEKYGW
jgi:NDP-sugar pyrophosphorylase family protein